MSVLSVQHFHVIVVAFELKQFEVVCKYYDWFLHASLQEIAICCTRADAEPPTFCSNYLFGLFSNHIDSARSKLFKIEMILISVSERLKFPRELNLRMTRV